MNVESSNMGYIVISSFFIWLLVYKDEECCWGNFIDRFQVTLYLVPWVERMTSSLYQTNKTVTGRLSVDAVFVSDTPE